MKKTLKKVMASIMAVASLATGMIGMSANAGDNSDTVHFGNCVTTNYVSCYSNSASAYAECYDSDCDKLEVYLTAYHLSYGGNSTSGSVTPRGKAVVSVTPATNNSFYKAECKSTITVDRASATSRVVTAYA